MFEVSLNEHLVNTVVDILRSSNSQILSIMPIKRSLEEIFVEAVESNE